MSVDTLVNDWFNAGMKAHDEGKSRNDYPFKKSLRKYGLDEVWQIGWDTAAMNAALTAGAAAKPGDPNPYTHPELAASWARGWNARHGLRVVAGNKNPTPRVQDARSGH